MKLIKWRRGLNLYITPNAIMSMPAELIVIQHLPLEINCTCGSEVDCSHNEQQSHHSQIVLYQIKGPCEPLRTTDKTSFSDSLIGLEALC